jgi:hypothetical protein
MNSNGIDTIELLTVEANRFFDDFVTAFSTFSGEVVARLFSHPYMAVDSDGNPTILESPMHTAQYFQNYLEDYKARGSKSCRYDFLEVIQIGSSGALLSATWSLQDSRGETIDSWSESYCVSRTIEGMLAYASIDHAA